MRRSRPLSTFLLTFGLLAATLLIWRLGRETNPGQAGLTVPNPVDTSGFARAEASQPIHFPDDLGPHPDYQTEWWYYTGNLSTATGRRFGFQLTFFRRALLPAGQRAGRASAWAADQAYMAHFTLSDIQDNRFYAFERIERGAAGLAGAQADPYQVWLGSWRVESSEPGSVRLIASDREGQTPVSLDLILTSQKEPVLQGQNGFSPKGAAPGQASYYYSQTRLAAEGAILLGETSHTVSGLSWKDHEWSTSALAQDQIGWDWFSIQLDDQTELMVFQIRRADGSIDPYSSGSLVLADGQVVPLQQQDFSIEVTNYWKSPHTGASYPAGWILRLPAQDLELEITPRLSAQELNLSYSYWEGAVSVLGQSAGMPVQGSGYVELTGYSRAMGGEF